MIEQSVLNYDLHPLTSQKGNRPVAVQPRIAIPLRNIGLSACFKAAILSLHSQCATPFLMCEYACFSCIFLSSFTHGMGIYLLLLSFNSVADLRCVIIDEAQPRGVLLRIKGTARRAVTWHHADVSLHRTQYQNLFHPGHGASATRNIFVSCERYAPRI